MRSDSNGSSERPDGGFTLLNIPMMTLIGRARSAHRSHEMVGLPEWARRERWDVSATSTLARPATPEERAAMMSAMLVERVDVRRRTVEKRAASGVRPRARTRG